MTNKEEVRAQPRTQLTCHSMAGCEENGSSMLSLKHRRGKTFFPQPTLKSRVCNNRHILPVDRWQVNCVRGGSISAPQNSLGAARLPCSRHKQIPKVSSTNPSLSESDREGWCLILLVFLGVGILAPLSRAPAKAHARQMAPRADKRQTASAPPSRISCPF